MRHYHKTARTPAMKACFPYLLAAGLMGAQRLSLLALAASLPLYSPFRRFFCALGAFIARAGCSTLSLARLRLFKGLLDNNLVALGG